MELLKGTNLTEIPNPLWDRKNEEYYIQVTPDIQKMDFLEWIEEVVSTTTFDADFQRGLEALEPIRTQPATEPEIPINVATVNDRNSMDDDEDIIPLSLPTIIFGEGARMEETFEPDAEVDENEEEGEPTGETEPCTSDPWHLALSTFWIVYNLPVEVYRAFYEIIPLARPSAPAIPKALQTLHKWVDKFLPPTIMREVKIKVCTRGLPAGGPKATDPTDSLVYCDPVEMAKAILQNPNRTKQMYFGPQRLVSKTMELWESMAWGSSILTCSGSFAYFPPIDGREPDPIFPGDVVEYIRPSGEIGRGRVRQVCKDFKYRHNGEFCSFIDPILDTDELEIFFNSSFNQTITRKLLAAIRTLSEKHQDTIFGNVVSNFLVEETPDFIYTTDIVRRLSNQYLDPRSEVVEDVSIPLSIVCPFLVI